MAKHMYMFEYIRIPFHKQQDSYEWKAYAFGPDEYKEKHAVEAFENCKYFVTQYTQYLERSSNDTQD